MRLSLLCFGLSKRNEKMTVMTSMGLQTGYASNPVRFTELLELIGVALGHFPDFEDLTKERFLELYLKLGWNYRDLMVLYFAMRTIRYDRQVVFDNVRKALYLLHFFIKAMTMEMIEDDENFNDEERRALMFDNCMSTDGDEPSYLYTQYIVWSDFMHDMFQASTYERAYVTCCAIDRDDELAMERGGARLAEYEDILFVHPHPLFHLSRPVNVQTAIVPRAQEQMRREMAALEGRLRIAGDGAINSTTTIGFPRMVAPWVDVTTLIARPARVPEYIGEAV